MWQAFVILLREGFESFLLVAITAAYLRKTQREVLMPAVYWGVVASFAASVLLGWAVFATSASQPLMEGILGVVSAFLVGGFVIHMWKTASHLKQDMEKKLAEKTNENVGQAAWWGVFIFTVFMISREGMETALMLIQVHSADVVSGSLLGALGAAAIAFVWTRVGRLINVKLFFQVTSIFLLLFVVQILFNASHEFSEAGIFPNSEWWHNLSEPYGPDGVYGKWVSLGMVGVCALWLLIAWLKDNSKKITSQAPPR